MTRFALCGIALTAACSVSCYDMERVDPATYAPNTYTAVPLLPDPNGWIAKNSLGIQGSFYAYGDQYDSPRTCTNVGHHPAKYCSAVDLPENKVPDLGFPNTGGRMCAIGTAAEVVECCQPGVTYDCSNGDSACCAPSATGCPEQFDYSNMWGAGIGLDFDLEPSGPGTPAMRDPKDRNVYDPAAHHVVGIAFDLEWTGGVEEPRLRAEVPMRLTEELALPPGRKAVRLNGEIIQEGGSLPAGSTTEEHPVGNPFWRNSFNWEDTAVVRGHNELFFDDLEPPPDMKAANYDVDTTQLLGLQFQVAPLTTNRAPLPFSFCITNLALLRE